MKNIFGQRRLTANSPVGEVERFMEYNLAAAWPPGWQRWPNVQQAQRNLLERFCATLKAPEWRGKGRGIVTAGGGAKYFPSLYALVRRLRELHCRLPVEVWYMGRQEIDPAMARLLLDLGCTLQDCTALLNALPWRSFGGWELKPYFLLWSRFAEVLWFDADVWPARDPTFLFEEEAYREAGAVLWPDYTTWHLTPDVFHALGVPYRGDAEPPGPSGEALFDQPIPETYDPPVESGQLLLDKTRCWEELRLAGFFCEHADYYFLHRGGVLHGDKETFRLAFRKLGTEYARPGKFPGWDTHSMIQYGLDGVPLCYHRTMGKLRLDGKYQPSGIRDERRMLQMVHELSGEWSGRPWVNTFPTPAEEAVRQELLTRPARITIQGEPSPLRLFPDGQTDKGPREALWSVFVDGGRPLLVFLGASERLDAVLPLEADGVFRGRRLEDGAAVEVQLAEPVPAAPVEPIPTGPGSNVRVGVVVPVVIRNERMLAMTQEAVRRVRGKYGCKVYVVLNALELTGFDPETLQQDLRSHCPAPLNVFPGRRSLSAAWNYGIVRALAEGADYVLLLANDAHLDGGCLDALVEYGQDAENGHVAVWSGVSDSPDPAQPSSAGCDFNCAMLRKRTVGRHGWFDENFAPAYFEDNDYYRRVLFGRDYCRRVHAARFLHHGSSTKRNDPRVDAEVNLAWPRLQAYFYQKWGVGVIEPDDEGILKNKRTPYGKEVPLWWWEGFDRSGLPKPEELRAK